MDYILNFEILDKTSLPTVGGKNASLGEMIKSGIRVPPGFAVTTDSYLTFISETGIREKILDILSNMGTDDMDSLDRASSEIQDLINNAPMNNEIQTAIEEGYSRLCEKCGIKDVPVAVRSSATAEDLPTASFAGQQDTYLWVVGNRRDHREGSKLLGQSLHITRHRLQEQKRFSPTKRFTSAWGFKRWSIQERQGSCSPLIPPMETLQR